MAEASYPNATITFVIEYQGKYLLVRRGDEENYAALWAFPGGKVEIGETAIETIRREIKEETGLDITDECVFLDSYAFKRSVGFCFLVRALNDKVCLDDGLTNYVWVSDIEDMKKYSCIPGIYNHLVRAMEMVEKNVFDSLEKMNLVKKTYINTM
jgi:mutator protein MutT